MNPASLGKDAPHHAQDNNAIEKSPQPQLLNMLWGRPSVPIAWYGYREELERAGVLVPVDRDSEFTWVHVQWRQPHPRMKNARQLHDNPLLDQWLTGLGERLVEKGLLQATHLVAPFSPATEAKVITHRWLAWMLVAKSSGHLWSVRCTTSLQKLSSFSPNDVAETIAGLCWHCAVYIRRDSLEPLLRETFQWEKDHESQIKNI